MGPTSYLGSVLTARSIDLTFYCHPKSYHLLRPTMCQSLLNTLCVLLLIPSTTLQIMSYRPHFTDGKIGTHCFLSVISSSSNLLQGANT